MKYGRKALSMPMEIIIAVVVLVVIALAVIMFTTGGITKSSGETQKTQDVGNAGIACQAAVTNYCAANPAALDTTDCTACTAAATCGANGNTFSCGRTTGAGGGGNCCSTQNPPQPGCDANC